MTEPAWQGRRYRHVKPCGTPAAYRRHLRHGEVPCPPCRQAEALRSAESRWRRAGYEQRRRDGYALGRAQGLTPAQARSGAARRTAA